MKTLAALLLFIFFQPTWTAGFQKGFVMEGLGEKLDDRMTSFSRDGYSGTVFVAQNGKIILQKGYGLADRERRIQNTPLTLYNVASIGKIFTAAAVLHLEMRGKLRTSDLISKYLGQFPKEKSGATVHHLLTHTAGLVTDGAPLDYSSRKAFIQSVKDTPLESTPGEEYRYSNAGYTLLAAIVEIVSGQPFEKYLQQNLFDPVGMKSTGYPWDPRLEHAPAAIGYIGDTLATLKPTPRESNQWGNRGSGNILTTVGDLYKWIDALRNNKVLSEQAKAKMFTPYVRDEGYGWHVTKTARETLMVRRGGGREDFESGLWWYIDEKVVVIYTVNNNLNFARLIGPALEEIIWRTELSSSFIL
jgi:CubicO group peptidase (beta-lactamase class C family)